MKNTGIFDFAKLPEYTKDFAKARVFIGGCGAVNSAVAEKLVKMGVKYIDICDYDKLEVGNLSKSSSLYRYPDDIGENKARAMASRVNELLGEKCMHGVDADLASFGPMAFTGYDLVILGLDNYAAKIYYNQTWLKIPKIKRPILIFGGTIGEAAQSNCINGEETCMRCLYSEEMLKNPLARSSCLGVQYRNDDPSFGIVITSGLASDHAANYMCEQARSVLLGDNSAVNKRILYNAHPAFKVDEVKPMKRKNCPDCNKYHPQEGLIVISKGNAMNSSLEDLFQFISIDIGHDNYEINVAVIEYAKVTYGKVIVNDFCKGCRKDLKGIYKHEFRVRYEDMLCDKCRKSGKTYSLGNQTAKIVTCVSAFSPKKATEELLNKKLIALGYRIGEIYHVKIRKGGIDFLDESVESRYYYFDEDQRLIRKIDKVEG